MNNPGLGLSIAKTIAEAHGGSIEAESRSGEGVRMTITLPMAAERAPLPQRLS